MKNDFPFRIHADFDSLGGKERVVLDRSSEVFLIKSMPPKAKIHLVSLGKTLLPTGHIREKLVTHQIFDVQKEENGIFFKKKQIASENGDRKRKEILRNHPLLVV